MNISRPSGGSTSINSPSPQNRRLSTWLLARGPARRRNTEQVSIHIVQCKRAHFFTNRKFITLFVFHQRTAFIYLIYFMYLYSYRVGWLSMHVLVQQRPVSHTYSFPVIPPSIHPLFVCPSIHPTTYSTNQLWGSIQDNLPINCGAIFSLNFNQIYLLKDRWSDWEHRTNVRLNWD